MHFYDDTTASQNGTTETPKHLENLNGLPNTFAVRSHKKQRKSCNNDTLQKIMRKNIQDNPRASKRAIYHAAFEVLSIGLNVVCARCSFSFLTKTTLYCQEAVKDITCFAYKDG
uniref:Ground-like domain-containing protein n=1 Tax=Acrobeloides nanus TaxID=290746 RepID=A0A914EG57_9BILA